MRTPDQDIVDHYFEHGFAVLPKWLDAAEISTLSSVCDRLLSEPPDDDMGGRAHDIGKGQDRRFLRHRHRDFLDLTKFVLGEEMREFLAPFIGGTSYLFNEQFVVNGPKTGAAFGWHQDGGYVGFDHNPYISVWIAIDDTTEDNGPVFVLPGNLRRETDAVPYHWDPEVKEMIGYDGPDLGISAIVPAGSIVLFSSVTLHRSSRNTTDKARRAYLIQYSSEPLIDPKTSRPRIFATAL